MPYVPNVSREINTNPRTPASLRATLAKLAKNLSTDATDISELQESVDALLAGTIREAIADSAMTAGQAVYSSSTGHVDLALADALATSKVAGIVTEDVNSGGTAKYAPAGAVEIDSWGLTEGSQYYLSDSVAGELVTSAPTSSGSVVQWIGRALASDTLLVDVEPSVLL